MANRRFIDFPIAASVGNDDIVLIWQDGLNKQTTKATLFAGSPNSLAGLTDVDISALANGQILQYNSTTSKWENVDRTDIDLDQLGDVTIVSPTNGQVLVYNSSTSKWENSSAGFVPYTGAVTTVNLGAQSILAGSFVKAGGTSAQFLKADGSVDSNTYLTTGSAAATYVPYTGATADVNLGTHDLTAERGTFQNNGSSDTLTVNHTSGSGYGIIVTKGGNNEALYVSKTSGSGNAMTVIGGRTSLVDLALSSVTNTAGDFLTISGGVVHKRTAAEVRTDIGAGTVTSVAALTLGTSGTDLSSTVANGTTTPVITLNVPTASATNRGALSSADWSLFNGKQNALTLTTTGTSGAATLVGSTLNIPQYQAAGTYVTGVTASSPLASSGGTTPNITIQQASGSQNGFLSSTDWTTFNNKQNSLTNPVTGTGTTNYLPKFTGSTSIGNSLVFDDGTNVGINTASPGRLLTLYKSSTPILQFVDNVSGTGASNGFLLYIGGLDAYLENTSNGFMSFQTNGGERMRIFSDGNLSISNSPSNAGFKLDVNGTGRFSGMITVTGVSEYLRNIQTGTSAQAQTWFASDGTTRRAVFGFRSGGTDNFTLLNERNGSLLIGTNDATNLTISSTGAATFSSSVTAGSNISINNSGTTIPNIGATSSQGALNLYSGASVDYNGGALITLVSSDRSGAYTRGEVYISAGRATNNTANGFIEFSTGDTPRMKITSGGNVLIGNIADNGSKLRLNGSLALPHVTKSANYTLDATDYTVGFDCASNRTANLPDATTCAGRIYVIYHYNTGMLGSRYVTIDPNGSQTINGLTTFSLQYTYDFSSVMIQSNGSNWIIISDSIYYAPV